VIATGQTSLCNEWGDPRPDFALADVFGVRLGRPAVEELRRTRLGETQHTFLRLMPELKGDIDGPGSGDEPRGRGPRHPVLAGFDETDILPFGGTLRPLIVEPRARVLLTYIPAFPIYPPESSWMREPRTQVPGLTLNESGPGRVVFLPADLDRRFAIDNLPDHGDLLANLVRWAARGNLPLEVCGRGLIDCELYQQPGRLILHLVNLTGAGSSRPPVHELIPVGPFQIKVRLEGGVRPRSLKRLVSRGTTTMAPRADWAEFEIESVLDHEVVVLES
jgi:hypothetical protein